MTFFEGDKWTLLYWTTTSKDQKTFSKGLSEDSTFECEKQQILVNGYRSCQRSINLCPCAQVTSFKTLLPIAVLVHNLLYRQRMNISFGLNAVQPMYLLQIEAVEKNKGGKLEMPRALAC